MCQAPVGKVIHIGKNKIIVEYNKKRRELNSKLVDVKEGDYVTFSLDIAIDRIEKEEAEAIMGNMS